MLLADFLSNYPITDYCHFIVNSHFHLKCSYISAMEDDLPECQYIRSLPIDEWFYTTSLDQDSCLMPVTVITLVDFSEFKSSIFSTSEEIKL